VKSVMLSEEDCGVREVVGVDESLSALQRGSKLLPATLLRCRTQPELQSKLLPSVRLFQVCCGSRLST
jgi:hypothetical protein